jgi:hypothetical protein
MSRGQPHLPAGVAMRAMLFAAFARLRNHVITGFIFIMPVLITLAVIMRSPRPEDHPRTFG